MAQGAREEVSNKKGARKGRKLSNRVSQGVIGRLIPLQLPVSKQISSL